MTRKPHPVIPLELRLRAAREGALIAVLVGEGLAALRQKVAHDLPLRDYLLLPAFKALVDPETPITALEDFALQAGATFGFGKLLDDIARHSAGSDLPGLQSLVRQARAGLRADDFTL